MLIRMSRRPSDFTVSLTAAMISVLIGRVCPEHRRPDARCSCRCRRSISRVARAAVDQRQITPAGREAVSDNLSDAGPTGD